MLRRLCGFCVPTLTVIFLFPAAGRAASHRVAARRRWALITRQLLRYDIHYMAFAAYCHAACRITHCVVSAFQPLPAAYAIYTVSARRRYRHDAGQSAPYISRRRLKYRHLINVKVVLSHDEFRLMRENEAKFPLIYGYILLLSMMPAHECHAATISPASRQCSMVESRVYFAIHIHLPPISVLAHSVTY